MSEDQNKLFIIRKIKKIKKGGHHGGSWKIAYADFVTAMMTFFLLMWLLAMMNKYQLEGIAEYFKKPITDAFKHQGLQVNRDAQKDKHTAQGIDKEKAKKEDEKLHKKNDDISKTGQKAAQMMTAVAQADVVGIPASDANMGSKVFAMQDRSEGIMLDQMSSDNAVNFSSKPHAKNQQTIFPMPEQGVGKLKAEVERNDKKIAQLEMQNKELEAKQNQEEKVTDEEKAKLAAMAEQRKQLEAMKDKLEKDMEKDPVMSQYKNQLNFVVTSDGLRVELRDLENKSMFSTGKADFHNYSAKIVSWLSHQLNNYPNRIMIIGHTDAAQYQSDKYTNWELSADRANATRRELIKNGMKPEKIVRIVGLGDTDLLDKKNGLNPSNRRIEIIVMTDDAVKKTIH